MDHAVLDEEDVGPGALGHIAAVVEHHGVGVAGLLRGVLGDGADHVEAGGLGVDRLGLRRRALVLRPAHSDALGLLGRREIARPVPAGDGHVDLRVLGRDPDHLRAAPGDRAQIGVRQAVLGAGVLAGLVDLGHREGDFEVQDFRGLEQTLGMRRQLVDHTPVHPLALEHGRRIVQAVREYVHVRLAPGHELAIQPDPSVAIVEGHESHEGEASFRKVPLEPPHGADVKRNGPMVLRQSP